MPPTEQQQAPVVAAPTESQLPSPPVPQLTSAMIPNIALSIGAGFAGRHYFGGVGGGLLGIAIYGVFLKPLIFSKKAGI